MNLTSPFLKGAAEAAGLSGNATAAWLKTVADGGSFLMGDGPDGGLGVWMSALAGVAAALAVAIVLSVYFRSGYRSTRDMVRHGLAAAVGFGLLAFVAYDMGHAALAYLGINPTRPAMEFEIQLPKAPVATAANFRTGHDAVNEFPAIRRRAL
jgi:hypothetical protein